MLVKELQDMHLAQVISGTNLNSCVGPSTVFSQSQKMQLILSTLKESHMVLLKEKSLVSLS